MSEQAVVRLSGPVFDGRAAEDMRKLAREAQDTLASYAEDTWQAYMDASFRHPTGAYQSHVNVARRDGDSVVNDGWPGSRLRYGPWLEGTGSRNFPVTRFPGYFALRRAAEKARREALDAVAPVVERYVREANA